MTAIDWNDAFEKYPGKWVAMKSDHATVVGCGDSRREAEQAAADKGYANPIMTRLPKTRRNVVD